MRSQNIATNSSLGATNLQNIRQSYYPLMYWCYNFYVLVSICKCLKMFHKKSHLFPDGFSEKLHAAQIPISLSFS
jgi:hypothetical protein